MTASITVDTSAAGTPISPDIYGQYLEHVEDCVEPGMITEDGLRADVINAARDLGVPAVRWPGGCFADLYHWEDGVGADRPVRPNWHWGNGELETNRFGTHEFLNWCEQVGAKPYINVNLGTGSLTEALRWLDYCTGTADTADVRARRANGRSEPWTVDYWGIGNETWGPWEAGHTDAADYANTLANWADFVHRYHPDAAIVGVGSSEARDRDWDQTVLARAGAHLDLLSLHVYGATVVGEFDERRAGLVHFPAYVEQRIDAMAGQIRRHNADHGRDIGIAVDEWNIRHWRAQGEGYGLDRADPRTGTDALCAAGFFHAMIKNADVVRMANYVFLVNGNGVLDARGDECRPTTLSMIFAAYQRMIRGIALPVTVDAPLVSTPQLISGNPERPVDPAELPAELPAVDAVACRDGDETRVALVNRTAEAIDARLDAGVRIQRVERYVVDPSRESLELDRPDVSDGSGLVLPPWSVVITTAR